MKMDPASVVIIALNVALIFERVVSRVRKSTCCGGSMIEFSQTTDSPGVLRGGALRSPPDDRDLIFEKSTLLQKAKN